MSEWYEAHREINTSRPDTTRYPWGVSLKNRYSKRLVSVTYFDSEKAARAYAKDMRGGDYVVKVTAGNASHWINR